MKTNEKAGTTVATVTSFKTKPFFNQPDEKRKSHTQFTRNNNFSQQKHYALGAETKHRIYNRLISILEGSRFANLSFVLHPKAAKALRDFDRMTKTEVSELERSVWEGVPVERRLSTIPVELYRELIKIGESHKVFDKRIVALPDEDLNIDICGQLERLFGRSALLATPGFILEDHLFPRLDFDEKIIERGFMMPILSNITSGLITGLRVFRRFDDEFPFVLRSRKNGGERWL